MIKFIFQGDEWIPGDCYYLTLGEYVVYCHGQEITRSGGVMTVINNKHHTIGTYGRHEDLEC